jgi:ABC-type antimicrobial peptide transport system permease subunit
VTGLTFVSLLLSLVGLHAVRSFVTTQRTREVGIRLALGGRPRDVVAAMFRRLLVQVSGGIAVGLVIVVPLRSEMPPGVIGFMGLYGAGSVAICALAILGPVRWAMRIPPTEALRAES